MGVGTVWVKDETGRLGLPAFKILGASWALWRMLTEEAGSHPPSASWDGLLELARRIGPRRLVTATDGNHGRGVARLASMLGWPCTVFVPLGTAPARIRRHRIGGGGGRGGRWRLRPSRPTGRRGPRRSDPAALLLSDTSWPGYEEVPVWVTEGYRTIFAELDEQLEDAGGDAPDLLVVQIGVGSLAAAAIEHYRGRVRLAGVEPIDAACVLASLRAGRIVNVPGPHRSLMAGLNCGTPSRTAWPLLRSHLDAVVAIGDEWLAPAIRWLGEAGIEAGETGAAGLAGLTALLGSDRARTVLDVGPDTSVVVLCTEGVTDPDGRRRLLGDEDDGESPDDDFGRPPGGDPALGDP
ncbi:MAG: hypothetical protein KatS3mg011_2062 [Acidimicrobiia bacterium]|nr:MAG: hypothetical protein KatS3mg011_2062 [Acidimicrobiia bacterium]